MMSQDNRLLPLPSPDRVLDRHQGEITSSKPYGSSQIEPAHLRDYFFVVFKRKWLILSLVLIVTSISFIHVYRQPSIYQASTVIQIEQKTKSVLQTKEVVINAQNDPAYWNTQLKLLQSSALARQVALTLDLQNNPDFFGSRSQGDFLSSLRRLFSRNSAPAAATPSPASNTELPIVSDKQADFENLTPQQLARLEPYENAIAAGLKVDPVVGTNLVNLRFTHTNPEIAHKIVNTMADIFVYNNLARETSGSEKAADLLAKEIADLQMRITRREEEKVNYARNHNLPIEEGNEANLEAQRLAQLSTQLLVAENERKNAQAIYEAARNSKDVFSVPEVQSDERIKDLRTKIGDLEEKRSELLATYTEAWPEVKKVEEQLKQRRAELERAPYEIVESLKRKYEAAQAKETSLRQAYYQQRGTTTQQNADQIQMSVIKQSLETDKQLYQTLLQRQRELQISANDKPNNVSVAEYSRVPRAPIGPARTQSVIIAFLFSLGAGIGLAFLLDYLDDTLKNIEDVDRYIHLPTLALIPSSRSEQRLRLKGKGPGPEAGEGGNVTALALIEDVRSPIAEAYRHLRTSLLLSTAGQPPKRILITSSQPSEGKTTTAVNTAVMLAQTGAEVLIIDCDLRRPRLHAHFGISNTCGLTNYLAGEPDIDSLLQTYEKVPNLKLLTSGPVPPNPAELISSNEMRKLLTLLDGRFTHIVIDSPPAISFTDASILSTIVDGVILVVHGGRSSRAVVRRAKQQLLDVGANIFGLVLNNVRIDSPDYYYYGYMGYYSSYYSNNETPPDDSVTDTNAQRVS